MLSTAVTKLFGLRYPILSAPLGPDLSGPELVAAVSSAGELGILQAELDWIVMKALEKDRTRRYETANGFAMDIQRYLADEPVQACPPSAGYRFRKFARRNWAALFTTATVAAALVAGIIGTTWQAIRATHEATRAAKAEGLAEQRYTAERTAREQADAARTAESKQRQIADQQRGIAEEEKQRAEENFDKARRAVDEYLSQVTESELLTVPGLQPLREDLLRAALTFYAEFTQERADDPTIRRELASAHYRLGRIHSELGDSDAAAAANNEAIRLYEKLRDAGNFDSDSQVALAKACLYAKRYDDTAQLCQDVLRADPNHAVARSLLADTWKDIAKSAYEMKDSASAFTHFRQAFELRESLVRDDPENPGFLAHLGDSLNNLGALLSGQGKSDEALVMFERGAQYAAQAYEREPHSLLWGLWLCTSLDNVARTQAELGRKQEALAEAFDPTAEDFLTVRLQTGTRGGIGPKHNLGRFRLAVTDRPHAARLAELAHTIRQQTKTYNPWTLLGMVRSIREERAAAVEAFGHALDEAVEDELRRSLILAEAARDEAVFRRLLEERPEDSAVIARHANSLVNTGEADAAISLLSAALGLEPDSLALRWERGKALAAAGRWQEAAEDLSAGLAPDHPSADDFAFRASVFEKSGQWREAIADWKRTLNRKPEDGNFTLHLVDALLGAGNWAEAAETTQRRFELAPQDEGNWHRLASALILSGDEAGYAAFCEELAGIVSDAPPLGSSVRSIKSCLPLPPPRGLIDRLPVDTLRVSLGEDSPNPQAHWYYGALALAELRSGAFAEDEAYTVTALEKGHVSGSESLNLAVRSMAQARQGKLEEARQSLEEVTRILASVSNPRYLDHLIAEILRREAEALLKELDEK